MIKDLFFIIKMLGLTAVVIVAMQARIGGKALEDHFHEWLQTSIFVDYIQEATDGGIALTKVGYAKADHSVHTVMSKLKRKNQGHSGFGFFKRANEDQEDSKSEAGKAEADAHTPNPE